MSKAFNAYYKWLGIPPEEQPANHYRLLAIRLFEDDRDVIESAADRQMAHVRTFQGGPHSADSQKLLNELSAARLCLLTPKDKAAYDAELLRQMNANRSPPAVQPPRTAPSPAAAPLPVEQELPPAFVTSRGSTPYSVVKGRPALRRTNGWPTAGIVALLAVLLVGYLIWNKAENQPVADSDGSPRSQAPAEETPQPKPVDPKAVDPKPAEPKLVAPQLAQPEQAPPEPAQPPAASTEGFVPLFNGKDLSGWKTHPSHPGNWRVEKGVLIGSGTSPGDLYSERGNYTNFHLRVETRINEGGNSGVFCRSQFGPVRPPNNPQWPDGYEAQINATHADKNKTGSLYGSTGVAVPIADSAVPANQWFALELIAADNRLTVKINGQTTAEYVDVGRHFSMGHFALQQHNPQTVVEFRKIEVREGLPAESSPMLAANVAQERGSIDLLKLIDPQRDAIAGNWRLEGGRLITPLDADAQLEIPYEPEGEYQLTAKIECASHRDWLALGVVQQGVQAMIMLDYGAWTGKPVSGLQVVDGKPVSDNVTTKRGPVLMNGSPNELVCTLRKNGVRVFRNGYLMIDWRGDWRRLSMEPKRPVRNAKRLFLVSCASKFEISKLELEPLPAEPNAQAEQKPQRVAPAPPAKAIDPVPSSKLTAKEAFVLKQHTGAVTRVAFHPFLPLLASGGKDGRVLLWNLDTHAAVEFDKFNEEVWTVKFSPDGSVLSYANRHWWGSVVPFKDIATRKQVKRLKDFKSGGGAVVSVAYSPDGNFFASGQDDGTVRLWETAGFTEILPVSVGSNALSLVFGPVQIERKRQPSKYSLAVGCGDGSIKMLELSFIKDKNGARWTFAQNGVAFPKQESVISIRFSPDGNVLASTRGRGLVSFFDPKMGQRVHNDIKAGNSNADWISFHPQRPWGRRSLLARSPSANLELRDGRNVVPVAGSYRRSVLRRIQPRRPPSRHRVRRFLDQNLGSRGRRTA